MKKRLIIEIIVGVFLIGTGIGVWVFGSTYGYYQGFINGHTDGYHSGYTKGHTDGYNAGHADGYTAGSNDGYSSGYSTGYTLGQQDYIHGNCEYYPFALLNSSQYWACRIPGN